MGAAKRLRWGTDRVRRKVLVTVTAMMLAAPLGSPLSAAQPSPEQLTAIANYLEVNDVQGLRDYITLYPELTEGETTLALLLRRFMVESIAADTFFRFVPNLGESVGSSQDGPSTATSSTDARDQPDEPDEPAESVY
jgi:hypothetical protein